MSLEREEREIKLLISEAVPSLPWKELEDLANKILLLLPKDKPDWKDTERGGFSL